MQVQFYSGLISHDVITPLLSGEFSSGIHLTVDEQTDARLIVISPEPSPLSIALKYLPNCFAYNSFDIRQISPTTIDIPLYCSLFGLVYNAIFHFLFCCRLFLRTIQAKWHLCYQLPRPLLRIYRNGRGTNQYCSTNFSKTWYLFWVQYGMPNLRWSTGVKLFKLQWQIWNARWRLPGKSRHGVYKHRSIGRFYYTLCCAPCFGNNNNCFIMQTQIQSFSLSKWTIDEL